MKILLCLSFLLLSLMQCGGRISLQEQTFIDLKLKYSSINVPTPFVYCTYRGQPYQAGAEQIIYNIQHKMTEMCKDQLNLDFLEFASSEEYYKFGNALSQLVAELEKKDMDEVKLSQELKEIINKSEHDMSVFILNIANPRTKAQNIAQSIGVVGLGVTLSLLTGFSPIMSLSVSSKLYFVIYSKSLDAIISFENSEDKDDPIIKENSDEEVDMLFSKFVDAKQVTK